MKRISLIIAAILAWILIGYVFPTFAFDIPWGGILKGPSIEVTTPPWTIEWAQSFGFKILGLLKVVVSGFALIYLVLVGVYMVVYADSEDRIKTQRKQIVYALIGFIFLNIPWVVYDIFRPSESKWSIGTIGSYSDINGGSIFWSSYGFDWVMGNLVAFLRVVAYGVAIIAFTWGLFRLIMSGWDEEKLKNAKHRLILWLIGLIFLGFVEGWSRLVAVGDFSKAIPSVMNKIIGLALFFAAPIAIFRMIWWAYYYITSGWDEERAKKGKHIVVNTLIATLILLAAMSFLTDLSNFKL